MNSELCAVWGKGVCEQYGTEPLCYIMACTGIILVPNVFIHLSYFKIFNGYSTFMFVLKITWYE